MKTIKIQLEYKCYPVWLHDDEGLVVEAALPPELADDRELNDKFKSVQERFNATYVDTSTDFYNKGFASEEEEATFKANLEAAVIELVEKCPKTYSIEGCQGLFAYSEQDLPRQAYAGLRNPSG